MKKLLLLVAFFSIAFVSQGSAQSIGLAGLVGNGFEDGYNFAFGIRGGVEIPRPGRDLYFGGRAIFHQGTEIGNVDTKVQYFGAEIGTPLFSSLGLKLLASAVLGSAEISADIPQTGTQRERKLFLSPGLILSIPFGGFRLGVDGRYLYVDNFDGLALYGTIGWGI